jgi:hypothetical protein
MVSIKDWFKRVGRGIGKGVSWIGRTAKKVLPVISKFGKGIGGALANVPGLPGLIGSGVLAGTGAVDAIVDALPSGNTKDELKREMDAATKEGDALKNTINSGIETGENIYNVAKDQIAVLKDAGSGIKGRINLMR